MYSPWVSGIWASHRQLWYLGCSSVSLSPLTMLTEARGPLAPVEMCSMGRAREHRPHTGPPCPVPQESQRCLGGCMPIFGGTSGLTDGPLFVFQLRDGSFLHTQLWGLKDSRETQGSALLQDTTSWKLEPISAVSRRWWSLPLTPPPHSS